MESSRIKRRRLMVSITTPVSVDLPAIFDSLNDDTLGLVLKFVGDKSHRSFGGVNKRCREIYISSKMEKKTFLFGYAPLSIIQEKWEEIITRYWREIIRKIEAIGEGVVFYNRRDVMDWVLQEQNKDVLEKICIFAAEEGRIDLLDEVWNNVDDEDDKEYIFRLVDSSAARGGKLNVLQWYEEKGKDIDKDWCACEVLEYGQLHTLKWLIEEKGLEFHFSMFEISADFGQLHVMKWLREQSCPWGKDTFHFAAKEGNLEVLQWLHEEGCPWPKDENDPDLALSAIQLKPEVINWCHMKGYNDRIS